MNIEDKYDLATCKRKLEKLYSSKAKHENELRKIEEDSTKEVEAYENQFEQVPEENFYSYEMRINEVLSEEKAEIAVLKDIVAKIEQYNNCEINYQSVAFYQKHINVEDRLDRKKKAQEIAAKLKDENIKNIGIFGEWGTGKSTFLEYIKENLNTKNENLRLVDIKATEYSDQEKIWAYLYDRMRFSIKDDIGNRIKWFAKRKIDNKKKIANAILFVILSVLVIVGIIHYDIWISLCSLMGVDSEKSVLINKGTNAIVLVLFALIYILPFLHQLMESIKTSSGNFDFQLDRNVNDKLGYKVVIKEYVDEIAKIWKDYTFIFFVDELDRCNNKSIMSFFESIQLFEEFSNIKIVYAIDQEIVLNAISEDKFINPQNYLHKYVDYKVDLFSLNTMKESIITIAKNDYKFSEEEAKIIANTMKDLEINLSVRNFINILNSLSEAKVKWINEEVKCRKAEIAEYRENALLWEKTIPVIIVYLAGSSWISRIVKDLKNQKNRLASINSCARDMEEYKNYPMYIKRMRLIDIQNTFEFIKDIKPLVYKEN